MSATNLTWQILKDETANTLDKGRTSADPVAYSQLPFTINHSEREIITALKLKGFETTVIGNLSDGVCIYAKPERFKEIVQMQIQVAGKRRTIFIRDYSYIRTYWPDETVEGTPKFYADHGDDHWVFGPTPDANYPWEVKFYAQPRLLEEGYQTNWLTENAPNLLRWATFKNFALFNKRYDSFAIFKAEYERELGAMLGQDMAKLMDRAAERDGA